MKLFAAVLFTLISLTAFAESQPVDSQLLELQKTYPDARRMKKNIACFAGGKDLSKNLAQKCGEVASQLKNAASEQKQEVVILSSQTFAHLSMKCLDGDKPAYEGSCTIYYVLTPQK